MTTKVKQVIYIFLIFIFSFSCLVAKYYIESFFIKGNGFIVFLAMFKWFSVWATCIAFIWTLLNLIFFFILKSKYQQWILSYNFKIFTIVYNLLAGLMYWLGLFSQSVTQLVPSPFVHKISFFISITGHTIIPLLLLGYLIFFSSEKININFYRKDIFYSLIFPILYVFFVLFRSLLLLEKYQNDEINLEHLFPYWFLSWIEYGWIVFFSSIIFFTIIVFFLTFIINLINNKSFKCKINRIKKQKFKKFYDI